MKRLRYVVRSKPYSIVVADGKKDRPASGQGV